MPCQQIAHRRRQRAEAQAGGDRAPVVDLAEAGEAVIGGKPDRQIRAEGDALPGEKRGLIPNATFYDKAYHGSWNGLTIISISIGQGEVNLTPLQIANLGATIANRGYYYTPHVVRKVQDMPLDTAFAHRHFTKANHRAYDYVVEST